MKWAFWKRKRSARKAPPAAAGPEPDFDSGEPDGDASAARTLRVRTRRRLIGACALLLAAVVLVPMVLDPSPHVVPDTIPIDLPSDRTSFAPQLSPPVGAAVAPADGAATGVPAAPGAAADTGADAAAEGAANGAPKAPAAAAPGADTKNAKKHAAAESAKGDPRHAGPPRLFVQAAAMARESTARELASRIAKAGLNPFVERTDTSEGVRYRVRLGPYASRSEAEHSRARLHALGVESNIVGT